MLALIKREIEDKYVYFIIAAAIAAIFVTKMIFHRVIMRCDYGPIGLQGGKWGVYETTMYLLIFWPFAATAMGAMQMYSDRDKKISSFLSTLATTRKQILTAKLITGFLWMLVIFVPIVITDVILLQIFPRLALPDIGFFVKCFASVFLCYIACYAFGLQIGWTTKRVSTALGIILVTPLLILVIAIKGFSFQAIAILSLFTVLSIARTWQKFMSSPL